MSVFFFWWGGRGQPFSSCKGTDTSSPKNKGYIDNQYVSTCFVRDYGLWSGISEYSSCYLQRLTWLRSIIKVDKAIDTVSLVCMRVKTLSVIPIVAESAGTKLPICARNTIKPTYTKRDEY